MGSRLLLVEDNPDLRQLMCVALTQGGHTVTAAACGDDFTRHFQTEQFDLILLDLNLPDHDGLNLLQAVRRQSRAPLFVVSGRSDDQSRIRALELGADDFVAKPFHLRELTLRISNFLRRLDERHVPAVGSWQFGRWMLNVERRTIATADGEELSLTRGEFNVLCCLVQARGNVVGREEILRSLAQLGTMMNEDSLTTVVYRLRQKLRTDPPGRVVIATVPGVGLRIQPPVAPVSD